MSSATPRPPVKIHIEADRREILRLDIEAESLRLGEDGASPRVLAFEGEVAESGALVSHATPMGAVLPGDVLQSLRGGNFTALRLHCGTGQVLPIRKVEEGDEAGSIELLRAGVPVSLEDVSILDLLMPEQHRHLARAAA